MTIKKIWPKNMKKQYRNTHPGKTLAYIYKVSCTDI